MILVSLNNLSISLLTDYGNNARGRNGIAPLTHSCNYVREIPELYRNPLIYGGIPKFYQKFTEAYSIPIICEYKWSNRYRFTKYNIYMYINVSYINTIAFTSKHFIFVSETLPSKPYLQTENSAWILFTNLFMTILFLSYYTNKLV